jgi:xylitol oxidase
MADTETNWAGNVAFGARRLHVPRSVPELQELVASADALRALGTRHSFSTIADTTGDLVSVAGLPRTMDVDAAAGT